MTPYDLKGRNVLVTGGSKGLGAAICRAFAAQGSNVAINFAGDAEAARKLVEELQSKFEGVKAVTVQADMSITKEVARSVDETVSKLGGIDVIIANAGFTKFSNFADLDALTEDEWDKCWATNVKQPHTLLKTANFHFQDPSKNPDGGILLVTSSIAALYPGGSSMAYCVTKTAQVQLVKALAKTQAPKVRANAILPGMLLTDWGLKYPPEILENNKKKSALQRETNLDDCAAMYVALAQNQSITGQALTVDAGLELVRMP